MKAPNRSLPGARRSRPVDLPGVSGPARLDRRTKTLTRRLRPGDVAIIDHADLDRVSAEALLRCEAAAVVNAAPSISGRYPNLGPQVLIEAGIPLVDDAGPELFEQLREGQAVRLDGDTLYIGEAIVAKGTLQTAQTVAANMENAKDGLATQLKAFVANTMEYITRDSELLIEGIRIPPLRTRLEGRHALVVARGYRHDEDLKALHAYIREFKPVMIGVDGGANALLDAGYRPDLIVGDMDSVSDRALNCGAEIVVHAYPNGFAPGLPRVQDLGLESVTCPASGTSEDVAVPPPAPLDPRPACKGPSQRGGGLDAALAILRSDGLEAVTMRRVAAALDTGPASLYVYVSSRDGLLEAMLDRVAATIELEAPDPARWRAQLHALLQRMHQALVDHPGIAALTLVEPPTTEAVLLLTENLLGILLAGRLDPQDAAWACDILVLLVTATAERTRCGGTGGGDPGGTARADRRDPPDVRRPPARPFPAYHRPRLADGGRPSDQRFASRSTWWSTACSPDRPGNNHASRQGQSPRSLVPRLIGGRERRVAAHHVEDTLARERLPGSGRLGEVTEVLHVEIRCEDDVEALVVSLVPVRWRAGGVRRHPDQCDGRADGRWSGRPRRSVSGSGRDRPVHRRQGGRRGPQPLPRPPSRRRPGRVPRR